MEECAGSGPEARVGATWRKTARVAAAWSARRGARGRNARVAAARRVWARRGGGTRGERRGGRPRGQQPRGARESDVVDGRGGSGREGRAEGRDGRTRGWRPGGARGEACGAYASNTLRYSSARRSAPSSVAMGISSSSRYSRRSHEPSCCRAKCSTRRSTCDTKIRSRNVEMPR